MLSNYHMFRTLIDIRSYQDQYDQKPATQQQQDDAKASPKIVNNNAPNNTSGGHIASVDGQSVAVVISNTQVKKVQQVEVEDEKYIQAALQRAEVCCNNALRRLPYDIASITTIVFPFYFIIIEKNGFW